MWCTTSAAATGGSSSRPCRHYGAKRGVCVDIDPKRIEEARHNADTSGVADRITFSNADLFQTDLREATVVTLYLLPLINERLRPKLFRELRPGTRVVSNSFDMGNWGADSTISPPAPSGFQNGSRTSGSFPRTWPVSGACAPGASRHRARSSWSRRISG